MTVARGGVGAVSDGIRGMFGGGAVGSIHFSTIDFMLISTGGTALEFGDLTVARGYSHYACSQTRGVFVGGQNPATDNTIDYITMASAGNASDFGDLSTRRLANQGSCSDSHGGLGGF